MKRFAFVLAVGCIVIGCEPKTRQTTVVVAPSASSGRSNDSGSISGEQVVGEVLEGTVLKKPWAKSQESWNAGGSDYYVLDTGGQPVRERTAAEGVVLLQSAIVTEATLESMVGKRVRVQGSYEQAHPVTVNPMSQYPVGPTGQPLAAGAGFRAERITVL